MIKNKLYQRKTQYKRLVDVIVWPTDYGSNENKFITHSYFASLGNVSLKEGSILLESLFQINYLSLNPEEKFAGGNISLICLYLRRNDY